MSKIIADLAARVGVEDKLTGPLHNMKGGLDGFAAGMGKSLLGMVGFTSAAALGGMAIKKFADYIGDSIALSAEAETNMARLNATLTATGRGAEISGEQVEKISASLMNMSIFDDDAITGAFNTLMKFESIPTGNMEGIVKTSMDMAAAMGGDLASNAEMLGRALETGVIPRTWGFNAALKEQFQAMTKAGDSAGALKLMMDELNKRYGGQAAAQLNTYNGRMTALKVAYDESKEAAGAYFKELIENSGIIENATQHFREQTEEVNLLTRARELGINVMGFSNYLQEGDLLRMVTEAENARGESVVNSTEAIKAQIDALSLAIERTSVYVGLVGSSIPTLQEMGVAAYQTSLTIDGSFTAEDAQKVLDYKYTLGLLTEQEYAAAQAAVDMQTALDALKDKGITVTTNWINNYIDYQNGEGIYNPGNLIQEPGSPVIPMASGGDWLVTSPTKFVAGEAGPERATFTPLGASQSGGDLSAIIAELRKLPRAVRDAVQQVI